MTESKLKETICAECSKIETQCACDVEWGEFCEFCGWCDTPKKCVWSQMCPTCQAPPGIGMISQCHDGARLVKLHAERWQLIS